MKGPVPATVTEKLRSLPSGSVTELLVGEIATLGGPNHRQTQRLRRHRGQGVGYFDGEIARPVVCRRPGDHAVGRQRQSRRQKAGTVCPPVWWLARRTAARVWW